MNPDGSHGADNKNKFKYQFDVYYCCAMIGMAVVQLDEDAADLKDLTESYPKLEEMMLRYLSDNETMLSEEGIKTLNAYFSSGNSDISGIIGCNWVNLGGFPQISKIGLSAPSGMHVHEPHQKIGKILREHPDIAYADVLTYMLHVGIELEQECFL